MPTTNDFIQDNQEFFDALLRDEPHNLSWLSQFDNNPELKSQIHDAINIYRDAQQHQTPLDKNTMTLLKRAAAASYFEQNKHSISELLFDAIEENPKSAEMQPIVDIMKTLENEPIELRTLLKNLDSASSEVLSEYPRVRNMLHSKFDTIRQTLSATLSSNLQQQRIYNTDLRRTTMFGASSRVEQVGKPSNEPAAPPRSRGPQ